MSEGSATIAPRGERGFTLIELLSVVAIIGILAAIAIPNLITRRGGARYSRAAGDTHAIVTQALWTQSIVGAMNPCEDVAGYGSRFPPA